MIINSYVMSFIWQQIHIKLFGNTAPVLHYSEVFDSYYYDLVRNNKVRDLKEMLVSGKMKVD